MSSATSYTHSLSGSLLVAMVAVPDPDVWSSSRRVPKRNPLRPGLDGLRLRQVNHDDAWVVFGGRRRLIGTSQVYDGLFSEKDNLVFIEDLSRIARGPDLERGTVLVRADEGGDIFLVAATSGPPIRHRIVSWETFVDFGFRLETVRLAPFLLLEAVQQGEDIVSAAFRVSREGRPRGAGGLFPNA